jgi:hypothetical protein
MSVLLILVILVGTGPDLVNGIGAMPWQGNSGFEMQIENRNYKTV